VAHILNVEQLKVFIPLLSTEQVHRVLSLLETDESVAVSVQRLHPQVKDELIKTFAQQIDQIEVDVAKFVEQLEIYRLQASAIRQSVEDFFGEDRSWALFDYGSKLARYEQLKAELQTLRNGLDSMNRTLTEYDKTRIRAAVRLVGSCTTQEPLCTRWKTQSDILNTNLTKSIRKLTIDVGIGSAESPGVGILLGKAQLEIIEANKNKAMNHAPQEYADSSERYRDFTDDDEVSKPTRQPSSSTSAAAAAAAGAVPQSKAEIVEAEDEVFVDEDSSVILYEAIKTIGNPSAIGEAYKISWTQIAKAGFRTAEDLRAKSITSLQELQKYLEKASTK